MDAYLWIVWMAAGLSGFVLFWGGMGAMAAFADRAAGRSTDAIDTGRPAAH